MELLGRISRLFGRTRHSTAPVEARLECATPVPATHRFAAGDLIANRYRIENFIARGGMGEVYAATDTVLNTRVALKFLRMFLDGDPQAEARFRREVKLTQQVQHTGVCRMHNLDVHDRGQFCVMELLDGETLASRLQRTGLAGSSIGCPVAFSWRVRGRFGWRNGRAMHQRFGPVQPPLRRGVAFDCLASSWNLHSQNSKCNR
ncbi:MAG: protein kinase [Acidobacteria bacterium]|nr:protein kinase [Acidobacteriota bacterium]